MGKRRGCASRSLQSLSISKKKGTAGTLTLSRGTTKTAANPCTAAAMTASELSSRAQRSRKMSPDSSRTGRRGVSSVDSNLPRRSWKQPWLHNTIRLNWGINCVLMRVMDAVRETIADVSSVSPLPFALKKKKPVIGRTLRETKENFPGNAEATNLE